MIWKTNTLKGCSFWRLRRHLSALRALCFILLLSSCTLAPDQQIANLRPESSVPDPKPYVGLDLDQRTLLANGGFEQGSDQSPDGWQPKASVGATVEWVADQAHTGSRSLMLANSFNGESIDRAGWLQADATPIQPDTTYLLRLWVRTEGVTAGTVWLRANYANRSGDIFEKETRQLGPAQDWTEVRMLLSPPSYGADSPRTAASLKVSFELDNSPGRAWFDDAALVALTPAEAALIRPVGLFQAPAIDSGAPPKLAPANFYRVQQADGVWWLVKPDGQAFWRTGVNDIDISASENPCHYQQALATYGSVENYRIAARTAAAEMGFSGDGGDPVQARIKWLNFSDNRKVTTRELSLRSASGDVYQGDAGEYFGDPFSPEWRANVEAYLDDVIGRSDVKDRQLIGYFTDNELRFDHLYDYIWSPSASQEFVSHFLPARYTSVDDLNRAWSSPYHQYAYKTFGDIDGADRPVIRGFDDPVAADLKAFGRRVVAEYIDFTTKAIRARDPNHLVISNRFAAASMPDAESADIEPLLDLFRAYDIIAVNISPHRTGSGDHYVEPSLSVLRDLFYAKTGRPILITEFSVGARDSGINPMLRWRNRTLDTQAERGAFYKNAVSVFANLPFTVGASWYKWDNSYYRSGGKDHVCPTSFQDSSSPDWDARNSGIVDDHDQPYPAFIDAVRSVNEQVRSIARSSSFSLDSIKWDTAAFTAPAPPEQLRAVRAGSDVKLEWKLGHEQDLAGYVIYRDDQAVATVSSAIWIDPGVVGKHSYRVAAYDVNSNTSAWSAPVQP